MRTPIGKHESNGLAGLGLFICAGLAALGYFLGDALISFKLQERSVSVKGLSEREYPADVVIWPIQFSTADNNLEALYTALESQTALVQAFLQANAIPATAISVSTPAITDKSAQQYGGDNNAEFRYTAQQTVTVYSREIDTVRSAMTQLAQLGKKGLVLNGSTYETQTEYILTSLNDLKPGMVEEATRNAREVAEKFAADSQSSLGKIKTATQGQFSISDRDKNNPHIKNVRVVSTVEYYLAD